METLKNAVATEVCNAALGQDLVRAPTPPSTLQTRPCLYGWKVDDVEFKRLCDLLPKEAKAWCEPLPEPSVCDSKSSNDRGSCDGRSFSKRLFPTYHTLTVLADLEWVIHSLASADIRPHLAVVRNIIWLSRNYVGLRGVASRGLTRIPPQTSIDTFRKQLGIADPAWLPLN